MAAKCKDPDGHGGNLNILEGKYGNFGDSRVKNALIFFTKSLKPHMKGRTKIKSQYSNLFKNYC